MTRCGTLRGRPPADMPTSLEALASQWRAVAAEMRRYGAETPATTLLQAAAELDAALAEERAAVLTLAEAAELSGYSTDHLARMIRDGKIPNAGRPNAPRIRRSDVPRKAGALPPARPAPMLSATQIARAVVASHASENGR